MIICLQLIDKNLYKTKSLRELLAILKRVNKLRRKLDVNMVFRRVYIPKASSGSFAEIDRHTFRPLGVPSLPWRIYLNMLEHVLVLAAPVNPSQHGFVPQKGTLTAWTEMFKDVLKSPHIYEIDLKQCFPSINLIRLLRVMTKTYKIPFYAALLYIKLNYATPEFKGELKCNEANSLLLKDFRFNARLWKRYLKDNPYVMAAKARSRFQENTGDLDKLVKERSLERLGILPEVLKSFFVSLSIKKKLQGNLVKDLASYLRGDPPPSNLITDQIEFLQYIGTTQGSPLSPYLSAIALSEIESKLPKGVRVLMYADDMIFYGPGLKDWLLKKDLEAKGLIIIEDDPNALRDYLMKLGFTFHAEKSGWVKMDGKAIKPSLKFLGAKWNFGDSTWQAATRKGSTLLFTKEDLLSAEYDINKIVGGYSADEKGEAKAKYDLQMRFLKAIA